MTDMDVAYWMAKYDQLAEDYTKLNCQYAMAMSKITELEKYQWISVKDGLPEPCKAVLVYGKVGDMVNWKVDYITECGMWAHSFTVTHWCYLPEPPKE